MKIYDYHEKNAYEEYDHPEDMIIILRYLRAHGTLYASGQTVEHQYHLFSECEDWANWIKVTEENLKRFAEWLDERNL